MKCIDLLNLNELNLKLILGSEQSEIKKLSPIEDASPDSLVFASQEKHFRLALENNAGCIITDSRFLKNISLENFPHPQDQVILVTPHVQLTMALYMQKFLDEKRKLFPEGIHPTAIISSTALIESNVFIGPYAVIGDHAQIKQGASIHAHCVVEAYALVGSYSRLHSFVFVGHHCHVGSHCEIHPHTTIGSDGFGYAHDSSGTHYKIPQLGNVIIEDHVEIGANCAIDRATLKTTRIGEGTKLDNLCHIAHNCSLGKKGLYTGCFAVAGSSHIGDHFVCGGRTGVGDHVKICDHVTVAGNSIVTNDVDQPGAYGGHPLQPMGNYLKTLSSLPFLPEIRKALAKLKH